MEKSILSPQFTWHRTLKIVDTLAGSPHARGLPNAESICALSLVKSAVYLDIKLKPVSKPLSEPPYLRHAQRPLLLQSAHCALSLVIHAV
jgi:hypothetical protein